jgi:hypothetical protein
MAETERAVMATTGLIQAAVGRKGFRDPVDALWRTQGRHVLGQIRSATDLEELISQIEEVKESTFDQQEDQVGVFLAQRHYTSTSIKKYVARGGLSIITKATYTYYLGLLNHLRQRYYDAPRGTSWAKTQAHGIWEHHSQKLLTLRMTISTKKHFLLKVYVYLREAHKAHYYHASMTRYLWNQVTSLQHGEGGGRVNDPGAAAAPDRCPHCRGKGFHSKLDLPPQKAKCPFKDMSQTLARKAAQKGYAMLQANPNLTKTEVVAQAKTAANDD